MKQEPKLIWHDGTGVHIDGTQLDWSKLMKLGIMPGENGNLDFSVAAPGSDAESAAKSTHALVRIFCDAVQAKFCLPLDIIVAKQQAEATRQRKAEGLFGWKRLLIRLGSPA